MTEFVIPVMYKQVDNEDKDCSCGRLPHTFKTDYQTRNRTGTA